MEAPMTATGETAPTNIYSHLTCDELIAMLTSHAHSSAGREEGWSVPLEEGDMAIEASDEVVQQLQPSDHHRVEQPTHSETNHEVVQTDLPTNSTASASSSNVVPSSTISDPATRPTAHHICPHCNLRLLTISSLHRHIICHEPAQLTCPTCGKVVKRKGDLTRHMRMHQDSWVCNGSEGGSCGDAGCGRVFRRKDSLIRHCGKGKGKSS